MKLIALALFVGAMTVKNRAVAFARRLRTPRYILSLIVGLLYFGFLLRGPALRILQSGPRPLPTEPILILLSVGLLFILVLPWASPSSGPGLIFQESELHALMAGPVSRRELILYRLGRNLPQLLFTIVMLWLFAARGGRFVGLLIAISMMDVYFLMVKMARARLKLLHVGFLVRAPLVMLGLGFLVYQAVASISWNSSPAGFRDVVRLGSQAKILETLVAWASPALLIPRAIVDLVYGPLTQFPLSAAIVLLFGFFSYFVATQLDVAFEEASVIASRKKMEQSKTYSGGLGATKVSFRRLRPPFKLDSIGRPEMAIFWKNLIAGGRLFSARAFGLFALPLFASLLLPLIDRDSNEILISSGVIALVGFAMLVVLGPLMFRNDLRSDASRLDLLKSFPLSGTSIVGSEVAAPAAILISTQALLLLTALLHLLPAMPKGKGTDLVWWAVAGFLVTTPMVTAQVVFQNAVTILLPGWSQAPEARGFAQSGHQIVIVLLNFLATTLIVLPPLLIGLPLWWLMYRLMPLSRAAAFAAPAVTVILVFEIVMAIRLLGDQLEKIDVANEIPLSS